MITVVNSVPDASVVKRVICRNCGSTLEYTPHDVTKEVRTDYGGGKDTYKFITCPTCNKAVSVS